MAKQQEIVLRTWEVERGIEINVPDIKIALQELIDAANLPAIVYECESSNIQMIAISSNAGTGYMPLYHYLHHENGTNMVIVSVIGKGEQVKAQDLMKLQYKAKAAWNQFQYGVQMGRAIGQKFGFGGGGISAGIGVATRMAITGTFKLAAKGIRTLLRDKEAYDREMAFYELALAMGDFVIGGVDSTDIISRLKEQAEKNNALSQYMLGAAYTEGRGVEPNESVAFEWFEKAAANGELRSQNIVAGEYLYSETTDYGIDQKNVGIKYLVNLADSGEEWAPQLILDIYGQGTVSGIPIDYDKTIEYAKKYAENGDVYSAFVLGQAYDTKMGQGIEQLKKYKNDEQAALLYNAVIRSEDSAYMEAAAMSLAGMAKDGRGIPQSDARAIEYYEMASNCGNLEAKAALIDAYTFGVGTEKSKNKAIKYCDDIIRSGEQAYIPAAYYSKFVFADAGAEYKKSMEYAKQYIACEKAIPEKIEELQKYLSDKEEKIANMTDEERWEYLGEKKPLFYDLKKKIKGKDSLISKKALLIIEKLSKDDSITSTIIDDDSHEKAQLDRQEKSHVNRKIKIALIALIVTIAVIILIFGLMKCNSNEDQTQDSGSIDYEYYQDDFIFYDSDSRYLTEEDVQDISEDDIQLAINEIYARHGRIFENEGYSNYFSSYEWYEPIYTADEFNEAMLNDYERANIRFLAKYRDEKTKISFDGSIDSEEEACEYALQFVAENYEAVDGALCDQVLDDGYVVRGYDDMGTHITTMFLWTIDRDGSIYDEGGNLLN